MNLVAMGSTRQDNYYSQLILLRVGGSHYAAHVDLKFVIQWSLQCSEIPILHDLLLFLISPVNNIFRGWGFWFSWQSACLARNKLQVGSLTLINKAWWHMPVILPCHTLEAQEGRSEVQDLKFKVILIYTASMRSTWDA